MIWILLQAFLLGSIWHKKQFIKHKAEELQMKKIEILIGSPRKKGNTYSLANMLRTSIDRENTRSDITYLYDYEIKPCVDCRACKKGKMECILRDDMKELYSRLEASEIIIIGTPIYWFGPSAQTKLMLDRFRPYYVNKKIAGKSVALLLPAGTGAPDCDLTIEMFKRSIEALDMKYLGTVTAKAYDINEAMNDRNAKDLIATLSARIDMI